MAHVFSLADFDSSEYLKFRPKYPQALYDVILQYHDSHGASRDLAVDLGCGPGQVSFPISKHFSKVLAVDPSESMMDQGRAFAKSLGEAASNIEFRSGTSESLPFVQDSSVDLIISGTAAHWFPPDWWTEAARVCKAGATVALFCTQGFWIHPRNKSGKQLQQILSERRESVQGSARAPGNHVLETLYDSLPRPQRDFSACTNHKWNVKGAVDVNEDYFLSEKLAADQIVSRLYTYGPSNTFAKNHPELVNSPDHPFEKLRKELKEIAGEEAIETGHTLTLLLFTRE